MDVALPRISPEPHPRLELPNMENLRDFGYELAQHRHPPPPPKIETSHGELKDFGYELPQNIPLPIQDWNFSLRTLCRGLVCGNYHFILWGYRPVSLCDTKQLLYDLIRLKLWKQGRIPVGCVPPACCPYLPACTAPGCEQNSWHTLLKIFCNFVAGGKSILLLINVTVCFVLS